MMVEGEAKGIGDQRSSGSDHNTTLTLVKGNGGIRELERLLKGGNDGR
jgi:hypothetical protein